MNGWILAALQGLGEYGALTGGAATNTTFAAKLNQVAGWASAHQTEVFIGAAALVLVVWFLTRRS